MKQLKALVDLHTHTTCSDGTYTPEELVQLAVKEGIQFLAITDHDEVEGVWRAKQEAEKYHNIQIVIHVKRITFIRVFIVINYHRKQSSIYTFCNERVPCFAL